MIYIFRQEGERSIRGVCHYNMVCYFSAFKKHYLLFEVLILLLYCKKQYVDSASPIYFLFTRKSLIQFLFFLKQQVQMLSRKEPVLPSSAAARVCFVLLWSEDHG